MNDLTKRRCGVCQKEKPEDEIAGIASSIIAAMSLCYCKECMRNNAVEREVTALADHPDQLRDEIVENHTVFHEGEYIPLREFLLEHSDNDTGQ